MRNKSITREDIKKLPSWVQDYIKKIEWERAVAVSALNEYIDSQTPSPFVIEEMECTGEDSGPTRKDRYIQTHKMTVRHAGVELEILLRPSEDSVNLRWGSPNHSSSHVAFVPSSFQAAQIIAKENMR